MPLICMLCIGLPLWVAGSQSPVRPSSSNSVARCDLMPAKLLGAVMCSPVLVAEPAWLGSQCCVKYTNISSGMTVCSVLLPVALTVCSHSASSDTAPFLVCRVLAFTDCCCRLAAAVKPFLYRWEHSCVSSFGAVQVLGVGVAHRLE